MPTPPSLFVMDGDVFVPTAHSTGPWSPDALHGGPVAALLAHQLDAMPTAAPMFPARFALELLRPVGLEPMRVVTTVARPGRKVQVLDAHLHRDVTAEPGAENLVARATLQQIRTEEVELPPGTSELIGPERLPPPPESLPLLRGMEGDDTEAFHASAVEHRTHRRLLGDLGPALYWMRVTRDLLPGLPLSPFEQAAAVSDFGNGISGVLPYLEYAFVNTDLSVFLHRLPVGEWVCLDAVTRLGEEGTGVAESELFDREGRIGRAVQSLIIQQL
jgi:hypothetical protein